jgi:uncharacterized protein (TIGR03086 family)
VDVTLLQRMTDRFAEVLSGVEPDQYPLPTPCPDWTVDQLIDHVITANHLVELLLTGVDREVAFARLQQRPVSPDRRLDLPASVTAQRLAFEAADPGDEVVTAVSTMTASRLLGIRIIDLLVHGWDLARAVGADERLPAELVAAGLAIVEPQADWMATVGVFGTGAIGAPEPADDQERLLQLTGRRPR